MFEQYKFEEVVTFPGAKELFLKFDEKCASQYNSDKVCSFTQQASVLMCACVCLCVHVFAYVCLCVDLYTCVC